ncbi:hypothetical protein HYV11_03690, partial [Candidatus Dependentiae bacterium]|nr:hypothetical protein [Candidatus Dependentiae bacterium]
QQGNIAPGLGTQDGQEALDNSVPVVGKNEKKKKSRVSVWDGKYIVFDETRKGIFHNHIRPWDNKDGLKGLEKEMKDALIAEGFVENTKGKIKKDAKKSK